MSEITVCCIKWGWKFGPQYVNHLYSGVKRNIRRHRFDFVCFTDDPTGIHPGIRTERPLCGYPRQWGKLGLFKPAIPEIQTDRFLYFDLACVIVGDLDPVIDMTADFAICRDWPPEMRPHDGSYASGAFMLRVGSRPEGWERFDMRNRTTWGDQLWIYRNAPGATLFPYDWSPSYKLRKLQTACPPGAKWIMFHGRPKPHECNGWVSEAWPGEPK